MHNNNKHQKRLLLVEDDAALAHTLKGWFEERGYYFVTARSFDQAQLALERDHFHIVVVDLMLDNPTDPNNTDGMRVLEYITERFPHESIKKIAVTAKHNAIDLVTAYEEYHIFRFVKKQEGYQQKLSACVEEAVRSLNINFDLVYDRDSHKILSHIANAVKQDRKLANVNPNLFIHEVEDLFGKMFASAGKILLQNTIEQGMTNTFVVQVTPFYRTGPGTPVIVKVGRSDKIDTEAKNCRLFVEPLLQANLVKLMTDAYTRHLGGICYSLAVNELGITVHEFDRLYTNPEVSINRIMSSLKLLFEINLENWYKDKRTLGARNLIDHYVEAFNLKQPNRPRLERFYLDLHRIFKPLDADCLDITFADGTTRTVINPLWWLETHEKECRLPIDLNITHGDLTGRNIMADQNYTQHTTSSHTVGFHRFYLIDFYRTRESHTLRDFVIFETDLKYRLYYHQGVPPLDEFEKIERALMEGGEPELSTEGARLFTIVAGLREMGRKLCRPRENSLDWDKEYLISILMATLNIIRLDHIHIERKKQAMYSAGLICQQLEAVIARRQFTRALGPTTELPPRELYEFHYRNLALLMQEQKLDLFIGRWIPDELGDWRSPKKLAEKLALDIPNYTRRPQDSFRYIFSLYKQYHSREELLREHVRYFVDVEYPDFFHKIAGLDWHNVFTTNQHNWLELACIARKRVPVELVDPDLTVNLRSGAMTIYKLYGSLSSRYRNEVATLPLSKDEYQLPETVRRIRNFQSVIQDNLTHEKALLMLFPSERDVLTVRSWIDRSTQTPEVYIVTSEKADELERRSLEQYRFKVLSVNPATLLENIEQHLPAGV